MGICASPRIRAGGEGGIRPPPYKNV